MKKKRVKWLFYAVNGVGLGHITRLSALSLGLRRNKPDDIEFEPLFFTNSDASSLLSTFGFPHVTVPSKRLMKDGSLSLGDQARLYSNILANVYEQFRPDVIVSDTFPLGVFRDLEFILRNSKSFHIFIHRAQKKEVYSPFIIDAQLLYDLIIAPHSPDSEFIPLPNNSPPLIWSDPLLMIEDNAQYSTNWLRTNLSIPRDAQVLLINLGGGGDENHTNLLSSLDKIIKKLPHHIYVIWAMGLLSETEYPFELLPNYRIINQYPLTAVYPLVNLAIATAGYNTFHELLYHGIPSIFLPQDRGYDDQFSRVNRALQKNACLQCEWNNLENQVNSLMNDSKQLQRISHNAGKYVSKNGINPLANILWDQWINK